MSKRWLSKVVAALSAAGFSLTFMYGAAGGSVVPSDAASFPTVPKNTQVSITLASYMPIFGTAGINELNSLVTGFEALHPNIHVTTETEAQSGAIAGQIQQDEVAGKTPDVVQDSFNDLKFITKSLGAVDLDKVVGKASVNANFGGTYRYAPAAAKLGDIAGDTYGIPWTLSTPVLFYDASLFSQAGLDPTKPPTNWTEVKADALKIKASTGAAGLSNGCVGSAAGGSDWCLQAIIDSAGGSVMNKSQTKLNLTNPKTVFALSTMRDLADSGAMVNLSSAQSTQAFAAGKLAMVLNSSAVTASLVAADGGHFIMQAAAMPGFGTKKAVPTNSGSALFMLSKSKVAREADWELMQYLTSPQSETTITENIGYPPLRPSIADQSQYLKAWADGNQFLTPNLFQLEHITPWVAYPGPNYGSIATTITTAATNIIFQDASPATTMASAQGQATGLLP